MILLNESVSRRLLQQRTTSECPRSSSTTSTSNYSIPWNGLYGAYTIPCNATSYLTDLNFQVDFQVKHRLVNNQKQSPLSSSLP
ncbi:hypothetical protein L596_019927 [Steinernema carpocapsae]|uniref:Uncharacterized protein n=1 Tax=Steinernema carpocapsae TaxID=34508 RepID=A0A4U5MS25_STECR|nr:hypothetical protein L596_019927 [Steinernema carpocapsae]